MRLTTAQLFDAQFQKNIHGTKVQNYFMFFLSSYHGIK